MRPLKTQLDVDTLITNYENTRELTDLIGFLQEDIAVLKSAIANLVDSNFGSVNGWTEDREVEMIANRIQVSRDMARVILQACDETLANKTYDIV